MASKKISDTGTPSSSSADKTPAGVSPSRAGVQAGLPTTPDLKAKFGAQKIPLAGDFSDLIDVADIGRKAVGTTSGSGLELATDGRLQIKKGPGITFGSDNAVTINCGTNLSVDSSGKLNADPFQKGMIIMFSGTSVPTGWALCDGAAGRPNLVDRFVLGGSLADVGSQGGTALSGSKTAKNFSIITDAVSSTGTVSVEKHWLTIEEIPTHSHFGGLHIEAETQGYVTSICAYGTGDDMVDKFKGNLWNQGAHIRFDMAKDMKMTHLKTSEVGGGGGHTHTASLAMDSHSHSAEVAVPYYILAFIIKL